MFLIGSDLKEKVMVFFIFRQITNVKHIKRINVKCLLYKCLKKKIFVRKKNRFFFLINNKFIM